MSDNIAVSLVLPKVRNCVNSANTARGGWCWRRGRHNLNSRDSECKMTFNPQKRHRRSIRLKGYDYTQPGAYFVTLVTHDRECLFGEIVDGEMRLNEAGRMAEWTWFDLPNHIDNIELDAFVVMPNHVHGIIIIREPVGAGSEPAPTEPAPTPVPTAPPPANRNHDLPEMVRQFKTFSTRRINALRNITGRPVWLRRTLRQKRLSRRDLPRVEGEGTVSIRRIPHAPPGVGGVGEVGNYREQIT
jgi:putative transposase